MLRRLFDFLYEKLLSRLGLALLALALLVNLGSMLAVDRAIVTLDDARNYAEHSRDVTAEILGIQSMLYESESAQRGFLYTGNESYLEPLDKNESRIAPRLEKLHEMVADDPAQQKLVDQVRRIAIEKTVEINRTIAIQKMGNSAAARDIVMSDQGKHLTEELDKEISRFLLQQDRILQTRVQRSADIQLAIRWGFAIVLFINALMILAGAVTIMRSMTREVARDRTDLVQQDEREAAEVVRHDKREAAEVVQQDIREAAEAIRQDERDAVSATEVVERAAELRGLTAHLLRVHEDERRTVARELHDELGGTLSAIKLDIIMGRDAAAKRSDVNSVARFQRALVAIDSAVQFVRRLIEDLRPTLLDNLGFEVALRAMADQFSERAGCECVIVLPAGELNLTSAQSTALYRICQEALTNVMKYAKAKRVNITLSGNGSHWKLLIADDGVGLDATKQHRAISHGLLGMRERIVALGGTFDIRGPAGRGTTLNATFPMGELEQPVL